MLLFYGVTGTYEGSGGTQNYSQLGSGGIPTSIINNTSGRIYNMFSTEAVVYTTNHNIAVVELNDATYDFTNEVLTLGIAISSTGSASDYTDSVKVSIGVVWQSGAGGGVWNDYTINLDSEHRDGASADFMVEVPINSNWFDTKQINIASQYISSSTDDFRIYIQPSEEDEEDLDF